MAIEQNNTTIQPKNSLLVCYHCGSEVSFREVISEKIADKTQIFCCIGCLAITNIIHEQGLDIFYSRRAEKDFSKNRPDINNQNIKDQCLVYDHPAMFEKYAPRIDNSSMRKTTLRIENIQCAACVWLNEQHWRKLPGVSLVEINYMSQRATIHFDDRYLKLSDLLIAAQQLGYQAWPFELSQSSRNAKKEERALLFRMAVAMLGMMQVMMYAWPTYNHVNNIEEKYLTLMGWAGWLLTIPVIFYSAAPIFKNAYKSIVHFPKMKILHMDVPIAIALGLSWLVGTGHLIYQSGATYFDSITMFVALLLLARLIELKARHQTQNTVEALAMQLPETCNLVRNQADGSLTVEKLPIRVVNPGDTLQVFPGEIIPVDGIVVKQDAFVSEAILTGESKGIEKKVGEEVYAGSFNLESTLYCKVISSGSETKLGTIAKLLEQTLNQKPKYSSISEKWASYFVLILLFIAALTGIIWSLMGQNQAWERALAVLVVTCPCAISLAIPLALAASHGLLAKLGLVVISSDGIEKLNTIDTVFLDKTGTITTGNFSVEKISVVDPRWTEIELLQVANFLEKDQNHPIAFAIRRKAESCKYSDITIQDYDLNESKTYQIGQGIICGSWQFGAPNWLASSIANSAIIHQELKQIPSGTTPVFLAYKKQLVAIFTLRDTLKAEAKEFIDSLKKLGKTPYLISGDDEASVQNVASELGINEYFSSCTPDQKLRYVKKFQESHKKILAIGDGVNDAPFLAMANVSIAIGDASPLSQSGADLILFNGKLKTLTFALIHAKNTQVIIRQNLMWGLTYNLLALPLAILGYVGPFGAAIGMSVSSIVVCFNAARLSRKK